MKKKIRQLAYLLTIMAFVIMLTDSCKKDNNKKIDLSNIPKTIKDIDSNVYHTLIIGEQVWLVENLRVSRYRNGDSIPNVTNNSVWSDGSVAYCYYNNLQNYDSIYGKLYNWNAVHDIRNIAPIGWHVATDADWTILINYLGGVNVSGGKLKEIGYTHWNVPNTGATNENGFTALPGGFRNVDGNFDYINQFGFWWTSSFSTTYPPYVVFIKTSYNDNKVVRSDNGEWFGGFSVRCIKDN